MIQFEYIKRIVWKIRIHPIQFVHESAISFLWENDRAEPI